MRHLSEPASFRSSRWSSSPPGRTARGSRCPGSSSSPPWSCSTAARARGRAPAARRRARLAVHRAGGGAGAASSWPLSALLVRMVAQRRLVVGPHPRRLVRRQQLRLGHARGRARADPPPLARAALARPRAPVHGALRSLLRRAPARPPRARRHRPTIRRPRASARATTRSSAAPCPAQFRSAWRLDRRRVLQGLVVEAALLAAIPSSPAGRARWSSSGRPTTRSRCSRRSTTSSTGACARGARPGPPTPGTPTRGSRSTRWSGCRATPITTRTPRAPTRGCAPSRRAPSCRAATTRW